MGEGIRKRTGGPGPGASSAEIPDKLYFRIGEVAKLCDVPAYVLRFWETEFPQLRPNKGGTGQRLFRRRDVEMALRIKALLYDEGYTIAGARQAFKGETRTGAGREPGLAVVSPSDSVAGVGQATQIAQPTAPPTDSSPAGAAARSARVVRHALPSPRYEIYQRGGSSHSQAASRARGARAACAYPVRAPQAAEARRPAHGRALWCSVRYGRARRLAAAARPGRAEFFRMNLELCRRSAVFCKDSSFLTEEIDAACYRLLPDRVYQPLPLVAVLPVILRCYDVPVFWRSARR
jgi:DNA-binding transcriptional MerR regulator